MTDKQKKSKTPWQTGLPSSTLFFCLLTVFFLMLLIRNAHVATEQMQASLKLCALYIIPSLFPFMVLSELLVEMEFHRLFEGRLGTWFGRAVGVSGTSAAAILLGAICGFPVGAKTVFSLYDKGQITKAEAEKTLTLCNIPGPGFVISTVGIALFSNRSFGIFLYFSSFLITLLIGMLRRLLFGGQGSPPKACSRRSSALDIRCITNAMASATSSMLSVCAYIVFFSTFVGCLSYALRAFHLSDSLSALLFSVFEISSGVHKAASLSEPIQSAFACGFAIGWSGLSVHFQIISLGNGRGLSFLPYVKSKLMNGLLCALASFLYVKAFHPTFFPPDQSAFLLFGERQRFAALLISFVFFICAVSLCRKSRRFVEN